MHSNGIQRFLNHTVNKIQSLIEQPVGIDRLEMQSTGYWKVCVYYSYSLIKFQK